MDLGFCVNDPRITQYVNEATKRLMDSFGETGFWGCWARAWFTVSQASPYITLPRQFARIINLDVCRDPITLHNEFYEFLPGGVGLQGVNLCQPDWCGNLSGYERGTVPSMVDLTPTNQYLRAYITDIRDVGKRILFTGKDQNGLNIYSQDGLNTVNGFFITFAYPFADYQDPNTGLDIIVSSFSSVQKDLTYGDVVIKQVDATTGVEVTLARYAPDEVNPAYRRYYINKVPNACCPVNSSTVTVTAIAKLEYIPVSRDTDQLLIGNVPALIEECISIMNSRKDAVDSKQKAEYHHARAVRLLQNEMRHYMGAQNPAVSINRWSGQPLQDQAIGSMR